MTVSDWGGTHSTMGAALGGLDVQMTGDNYFGQALIDSVRNGALPEAVVDNKVREILRLRHAVEAIPDDVANTVMTSQPAQQKVAYEIAQKSIVLLKNEDKTLPISKDIKNENNVMGELGYRFVHDNFGAEATFYAALWKNKTIKSNPYKPLDDESYRFMVTGLDAFHYGGEMELFYRFGKVLRVDAFASIGDWRWKNDVHATIYDPYTEEPMELIDVYSHNLHVGDAPQTQVGASFEFHPLKLTNVMNSDITVSMRWSYNDRFWADFDPISRTDADDRSDSYRIPAYHLLDMNVSWSQRIRNTATVTLFFNLNNILDAVYVERGKDGAGHDAQSFTGYWGAPRNYNFGVRLSF
jgi:outer membrane receptor for Fe3+-dicitrate